MQTNNGQKLTPEQVENWRNILASMIGPYALIMSEDKIQRFCDRFQERADQLVPVVEVDDNLEVKEGPKQEKAHE